MESSSGNGIFPGRTRLCRRGRELGPLLEKLRAARKRMAALIDELLSAPARGRRLVKAQRSTLEETPDLARSSEFFRLRAGFDAVQAALPVLRDKIDLLSAQVDSKLERMNAKLESLYEKMGARIDALDAKTNARINAVEKSLSEKIDEANEQRAAGDAALGEKIDKLTERVLEVQGHQKAVLWVVSISTVIASLVSIARTLGWI